MLHLRYLHNNTYKRLKPDSAELIGIHTRANDVEYVNWLGTIERTHAIGISHHCSPVRLMLSSYAFNSEEFGIEWIDVENGTFVQGCYVPSLKGVFVVVEEGRPRIVAQKYSMSGAYSGKY
jgi:hypothetical protein